MSHLQCNLYINETSKLIRTYFYAFKKTAETASTWNDKRIA